MKEKHTPRPNSHHYVAYDPDSGIGLADNLIDLMKGVIEMADEDGPRDLYLYYLPEPSDYATFDRNDAIKFGPMNHDNRPIGIPLYLGTDPHNTAIVHKKLTESAEQRMPCRINP